MSRHEDRGAVLAWMYAHPAEAARLMGYEVVEEETSMDKPLSEIVGGGVFMRLIDADELERDLREQFEQVFWNAGRKVLPDDYYIERVETYRADVRKAEYDGFFAYLRTRPTISPSSLVKWGRWEEKKYIVFDLEKTAFRCSECKTTWDAATKYCPNCGAWMQTE